MKTLAVSALTVWIFAAAMGNTAAGPSVPRVLPMPPGTGSITGVVQDPTGKPVADAQVIIVATGEYVKTDKDGKFVFVGEDPASYTLRVNAARYKPATGPALLKPNGIAQVTLILTPFSYTRRIMVDPQMQPNGTHSSRSVPVYPDPVITFGGDLGLHSTARSR